MFRSLRSVFSVVASATVLLLASGEGARAQTGLRQRWDTVTLGNNYVGIDAHAWACTRNNAGAERRVDEMLRTDLRLLNLNVELQRIAATAIRTGNTFGGWTSFRRGGFTVHSATLAASGSVSFANTAALFPSNRTLGIPVGPFTVTVGANIGHTGTMNLSLLNMSNYGAMLSGAMETYAWGWASASVTFVGVGVGVSVDIRIGRQSFDGVLGSFTNYLSTAYLNYTQTALRLWLRVFLIPTFLPSFTLVDASFGSRTLSPFLP
jgi:hypothetical protein